MVVKHNVLNNDLYLYFYGEIDEHGVSNQKSRIDKIIDDNSYVNSVIFNFQNVSFMDSTGIGMLIGRYKKIKSYNKAAFVQNPTQNVQKIMQISGLYKILPKI